MTVPADDRTHTLTLEHNNSSAFFPNGMNTKTVSESEGMATFNLSLDVPAPSTGLLLKFSFSLADNLDNFVTFNSDGITPKRESEFTVDPRETSYSITVYFTGNNVDEPDRIIGFFLSNPKNFPLRWEQAIVAIPNGDAEIYSYRLTIEYDNP